MLETVNFTGYHDKESPVMLKVKASDVMQVFIRPVILVLNLKPA